MRRVVVPLGTLPLTAAYNGSPRRRRYVVPIPYGGAQVTTPEGIPTHPPPPTQRRGNNRPKRTNKRDTTAAPRPPTPQTPRPENKTRKPPRPTTEQLAAPAHHKARARSTTSRAELTSQRLTTGRRPRLPTRNTDQKPNTTNILSPPLLLGLHCRESQGHHTAFASRLLFCLRRLLCLRRLVRSFPPVLASAAASAFLQILTDKRRIEGRSDLGCCGNTSH